MPQIQLRDYQREALAALVNKRQGMNVKQLVSLPTGSGKTIVAAQDIKNFVKNTGSNVIFMAHRDELIKQAAEKIRFLWPDADIGVVKAKDNELNHKVTVASVQTISRDKRLRQLCDAQKYGLLYVDEAHHSTAKSYKKIINELTEKNPYLVVVGLTATPVRSDATKLGKVFDSITFSKSMIDLIRDGFLSDISLKMMKLEVTIDDVPVQNGDLKSSDLSTILNDESVVQSMVEHWKKEAEGRRTIVFALNIPHTKMLADAFNNQGIAANFIHSEMESKTRKKNLDDFQSGKIRVLVNCMILTEGFDDNSKDLSDPLACVMLARPTLSQSLYIQMIGRGTRPGPHKENCLVLDFAYNSKRHHLVQLPHLFGMEPIKRGKRKPKDEEEEEKLPDHIPSICTLIREAESIDVTSPPPRAGFRWSYSKYGHVLSLGDQGFLVIRSATKNRVKRERFNVFHYDPIIKVIETEEGYEREKIVGHRDHKLTTEPLPFEWAFGLAEDACRNMQEARSKNRYMKRDILLQKEAEWHKLPPTKGQLKVLERFEKNPKNRGDAADMISAIMAERVIRGMDPATPAQKAALTRYGVNYDSHLSKNRAGFLLSQLKKNSFVEKDAV